MKLTQHKEKLVCDCKDGGKHQSTVDIHGETVEKCEVCKRFIKHPAQ